MATLSTILSQKGRDVVTTAPHRTVREVAQMLHDKHIGAVVVAGADGIVLGIFSERDVVRLLAQGGAPALDDSVSKHMTSKVVTASEDTGVLQLMEKMTEGRFRHIPVVEDGRLLGLVSIGDLVKHRIAEIETERQAMLDYIGTA